MTDELPRSPARPAGRHPLRADAPLWDRLALALFAGLAVLIVVTFQDYGITWDAEVQDAYGRMVLAWYRSFGRDDAALDYLNLYLYGGLFDGLAALAGRISPFGEFETRGLINALFGLVGIVGCWRLARRLGGPRAGLTAALLLALTPDYYGSMFINPKDIPFAAGMTWSTGYLVAIARTLPAPPRAILLKFGLALGLTLAVRVGGVLVLPTLAFTLAAFALLRFRAGGAGWSGAAAAGRALLRIGLRLLPALLLAYALMLAFWPWAQQNPLRNPLEALREFGHFSFDIWFLFNGDYVPTQDLPWDYLPLSFLVKLPEMVLLGLALVLPAVLLRRWPAPALPSLVLGFALLFPPVYIVATNATLYDTIRHVLFLVPLCAVAAALGFESWLPALARLARPVRLAAGAGAAVWLAVELGLMVALHPNQYIYYNAVAGGVPGAEGRFELDYWGNSLRQATLELRDRVILAEGIGALLKPYRVRICGPELPVSYYLPASWEIAEAGQPADFYVALRRFPCGDEPDNAPLLVSVERLGAVLSQVLDLRHLPAAPGREPAGDRPGAGESRLEVSGDPGARSADPRRLP